MIIPKLKRIKVSAEQELCNWLNKNSEHQQDVMIVSCNKKSRDKYISGTQVRVAVRESGWDVGRRYTLDGSLNGQIAAKSLRPISQAPGQAGCPSP